MKWASLDLSSSTGFAIFDRDRLIDCGLIEVPIPNYDTNVSKYTQLPVNYPENLIGAASKMVEEISKVLVGQEIKFVAIEHTEGSSRRFSQRYLEWLHLCMIMKLKRLKIPYRYLFNSDWRAATGCYLKHHPDLSGFNKQVRKAKKKATPNKAGARVAKIDGKVVKAIGGKELSIIVANRRFGLEIDSDDIADALNLGDACLRLGVVGTVTDVKKQSKGKT